MKGQSIRATAKEFKVHRREVRRALASAIPPEPKTTIKMPPKLGALLTFQNRPDVHLQLIKPPITSEEPPFP